MCTIRKATINKGIFIYAKSNIALPLNYRIIHIQIS